MSASHTPSAILTVTRSDIRDGLLSMGIGPGDVVLVHSSLSAFGHVEGGADTVIDALLEVLTPSGTLVMPTFTWGDFHAAERVEFDTMSTPCETGRIPETFRLRPGVTRSLHVCHSVAAAGPETDQVLGEGVSSFGPGSSFDGLLKLGAWVLFLGVSFQCCTALHAVEEFVGVPYRTHRNYEGSTVILPDHSRVPSRSIEYLRQDRSSNDFAKMGDVFRSEGVLNEAQIGAADCMGVRIQDLFRITRPLLEQNTQFLSRERPRVSANEPAPAFESLGEPLRVRELSFQAVTQDPDGYHILWACFLETVLNSTALVGVRTDTGETIRHDLSHLGEGKVTLTRGADGNVYVYAGNPAHFLRYDVQTRTLQDLGVPADPAHYFAAGALAPDGWFYVGSYPGATLVRCNTNTGAIESIGRLADDERQFYIFPSVAISDDNVIYCPVGLHHMECVAYNGVTGERKQILPDRLTELQGAPRLWTGEDGRVYGKAGGETFLCQPDGIVIGETAPARNAPPLVVDGKRIGAIDENGSLQLTDEGTGAVTELDTNYGGKRVWLYSVSCERDGKVYGSGALPGLSFSFDTATGEFADLGILGSGNCQVYDTISLPEGLVLCSYMGAWVDVYDPARPIEKGTNPRCLGRVQGQERPIQWCLGPDGRLYSGTHPAKGRLGGTLMSAGPQDESLKVWPTPIPDQSIEYVASVPETGELFCTTSIQGGSSSIPTAEEACVFLWDIAREEMVFQIEPVPGTKTYQRAVTARNGLVYGLAGDKYYVFDPKARAVTFVGDLPVKALRFPHLHREPVGPNGLIVGLGDDAVYCIDPSDNSTRILARHPSIGAPGKRGAHGFFVTEDGVLYFCSEATLMRVKLPL